MTRFGILLLALLAVPSASPGPLIREEQPVMVDGHAEIWRLEWSAEPTPACPPAAESLTCPCTGFAYGESGDLWLVRLRDGEQIDRLQLAQFFQGEQREPILERWPSDFPADSAILRDGGDLATAASRRDAVQVMHFADYNHDGWPTEFYLHTDNEPCGKSKGLVIGVTPANPKLHALGSASHPGEPLQLFQWEWEALRQSTRQIDVRDWACFDHGAETETRLQLWWTPRGVGGTRREYSCPGKGQMRRLLREDPL